jgi:putative ABC transport system ATP-binding protein
VTARDAGDGSRPAAIHIRGLDYAFGVGEAAKQVLFGIDLDVAPGEFVIMTGPSGSGKTTLLGLVGALRRPQAGELVVCGRDLTRLDGAELESYRSHLGFIFQLHNLFPALTAEQSVQMAADLRPDIETDPHERIVQLLSRLGLGDRLDYKPERLSGGQRQRVAIARALVHHPEVVLADEPTAALDGANTEIVLELFRERALQDGTTVLMVTQDARVFDAADRLVNLVDGRIESDTRRGERRRTDD